jgi:hypothetical protein
MKLFTFLPLRYYFMLQEVLQKMSQACGRLEKERNWPIVMSIIDQYHRSSSTLKALKSLAAARCP